ncbi:hypothetical protein ROZALSC1DRAFT_23938 [Rozella allomycis CSF55]|uniref:FAM86 N-terminal domain-containing protein n=1 Tax=Rozella allomycis (strain CSF55) TaxID=988480 RepID=A0A4P9YES6_ROZAC|nr:hypothetical protein ROZALSC1DRAFT_23938 [Rozella allomycis CSF55]
MDLENSFETIKGWILVHSVPFKTFKNYAAEIDSTAFQILILDVFQECLNEDILDLPYIQRFIKLYIHHLEDSFSEVSDQMYEFYAKLLNLSENRLSHSNSHEKSLRVLSLNGIKVKFKVDINKISNGTTGLSVWSACFAVLDYLCKEGNSFIVKKRVLEIGSGIGLLALGCAALGAENVIATDAHSMVLNSLNENLKISNFDILITKTHLYKIKSKLKS